MAPANASRHALAFYDRQFLSYLEQGMTTVEADVRANEDLRRWEIPLELPAAPESDWWE